MNHGSEISGCMREGFEMLFLKGGVVRLVGAMWMTGSSKMKRGLMKSGYRTRRVWRA